MENREAMKLAPDYDLLTVMQKVEVFETVLHRTLQEQEMISMKFFGYKVVTVKNGMNIEQNTPDPQL